MRVNSKRKFLLRRWLLKGVRKPRTGVLKASGIRHMWKNLGKPYGNTLGDEFELDGFLFRVLDKAEAKQTNEEAKVASFLSYKVKGYPKNKRPLLIVKDVALAKDRAAKFKRYRIDLKKSMVDLAEHMDSKFPRKPKGEETKNDYQHNHDQRRNYRDFLLHDIWTWYWTLIADVLMRTNKVIQITKDLRLRLVRKLTKEHGLIPVIRMEHSSDKSSPWSGFEIHISNALVTLTKELEDATSNPRKLLRTYYQNKENAKQPIQL